MDAAHCSDSVALKSSLEYDEISAQQQVPMDLLLGVRSHSMYVTTEPHTPE